MALRSTLRITLVLAVTLAATAASGGAARAAPHELEHGVGVDTGLTLSAMGLVFESQLGQDYLAPNTCRWCDRSGRHDSLNPLDGHARELRWDNGRLAARVSDGLLYAGAPAVAFGGIAIAGVHDVAGRQTPVDLLLVMEAVSIDALLTEAVKFIAGRERPYAHARALAADPSQPPPARSTNADDNLSFLSGHTSITFALASASGTIASLRGYRLAPAIWAAGLSIGAAAGYLRIAADMHYLTDVLSGALLGTAVGVLVPLVFHPRVQSDDGVSAASTTPAPRVATQALGWGGVF